MADLKKKLIRAAGPAIGLIILSVAVWVLHACLREYRYRDIVDALASIPRGYLLAALGLTILNYAILTGYDFLALKYITKPIHYRKIAFTSFVSYAFSQNLGFGLLTGGSLRYRLYSAWGLTAAEITNVVAFCALTFWLGIFTVGGLVFTFEPLALPASLHLPFESAWPIGVLFLVLSGGYLGLCAAGRGPLKFWSWEFPVPSFKLALAQIITSGLDWTAAGAVLYVLLPDQTSLSLFGVLAVFLLAQVVGLISHVPGGLGVFEAMILYSLTPELPASTVLASLLAFRIIYYLLPLGGAVISLGSYEFIRTKWGVKWLGKVFVQWVPSSLPTVLAITTFISGVVLLFSGATPALAPRLVFLTDFLPLSVIEFSHFLGSIIGVALLFLAWAVQRRVDAAYYVTAGMLALGIVASLLKGFDYEEALILTVVLAAFIPCRQAFYRKSSLISRVFSVGWISAISVAILASVWLGFFSNKHVEYQSSLWWQFSIGTAGDASRFLRATVGVVGVALIVAIARLLRPAPPKPSPPTPDERAITERIVAANPFTVSALALLGDKYFLFSSSKNAFIMYGIEGNSWIAMGDPVGPVGEWRELLWRFRELATKQGAWAVFYQVRSQNVALYLDLGLTMQKLGEEARVDLATFSIDKQKKTTRHSYRKAIQDGIVFEIVPVTDVPRLLPRLKQISDAWLEAKNTREKSFSLGSFNPRYLARFPMAIATRNGEPVAFANVLCGAEHEELSIDLMRFTSDSPPGTMDFLFLSLMQWGKENGYRWFNLGMAPLSGMENRPLAPLWMRVGALIFKHGELFYNFQGLRAYKEKFGPEWEPRYLASPGGLSLPLILANAAALVSGGMKGIITK